MIKIINISIFYTLQVDEVMMNKVLGYIEKGKQEGAKLMSGGKRVGDKGYYIEPTVFADVTDDMTIAKEEVPIYINNFYYIMMIFFMFSQETFTNTLHLRFYRLVL